MKILKKGRSEEEIIASFHQPSEGDKIALLIAVFLLSGLLIILILLFSMDSLLRFLSPSLLILFIASLFCILLYIGFCFVDKAKIGYSLVLTNKRIKYRKSSMDYDKVKGIYYCPHKREERFIIGYLSQGLALVSRYLSHGFALVSISPEDLRELLGQNKEEIANRQKLILIKDGLFFIPMDIERLPELLKMLSRYIPQAELDLETFLFKDVCEGGYLLANSSDLFQAEIYDGKSSLPALHNFFLGLRDLLRFNLSSAYQKLNRAFSYGELRARPYLALTQYLLQKYDECISLLTHASPALNAGERLILASSLAKQGRWEAVREMIEELPQGFSQRFQLGYLCAKGNWQRLIELGAKQKDGVSLNLCLNCARQLLLKGPIKPPMEKVPSPPRVSWRYYLGYLLTILSGAALALLKSWHKGFGVLLYFLGLFLLEWLPRKYMTKELFIYLIYQLNLKFASPYWCTYAYLEELEIGKKEKSLQKGGLESERG
ncbi:hypothetical protein H5T88_08745 [bacterium]|nr:hypothetical protein [bacterium]